MSGRKTRTTLTKVLDMTLAGRADDVSPEMAANAIREHETLTMDLIEARQNADDRSGLLAESVVERATLRLQLAEAVALLRRSNDYLNESHRDEMDHDHYGDGSDGCSYCESINASVNLLARFDGATDGGK